jgi:hypothetical protein
MADRSAIIALTTIRFHRAALELRCGDLRRRCSIDW